MADIKFYKVNALPGTAEANAIYYVKSGTSTKIYVTDTTGTPYGVNSADAVVSSVNSLNGNVQLELSLSGGSLSITGGTTPVNLDNRYLKTTDNIAWSKVTGTPTTIGGYGITDAYTKSEVTAITGSLSNLNTSTKSSLVSAINELNTALADQLDVPSPIDCSTNPNYPASNKGDTYKVTVAGKIGGASGIDVGVGDLIICTANTSGGDQAAAGSNFFVVASNVDMATDAVAGIGRIATQAEVNAGTENKAWVTPDTINSYLTSNYYTKTDINNAGYLTYESDPQWTAAKSGNTTISGNWSFPSININSYYDYGMYVCPNNHPDNNGILIETDMVNFGKFILEIEGYGNYDPAKLIISGLNYTTTSSIENINSTVIGNINNGDNDIKIFLTDNKVTFWIPVKNYSVTYDSGIFHISFCSMGNNIITNVTTAPVPTTLVTGLKTISPTRVASESWVESQNYITSSSLHDPVTLGVNKNGLSLSGQELQLSTASTSSAGAMSAADKSKLNGIASGANNYTLPKASTTVLGGVKIGSNMSIDGSGKLTANNQMVWAATPEW